ncbi:hypothetical protein TWF481_007403 [Arthrobotrys musiformis]|uniref:F-box domain-containing protein n=1 Tax=Arthrobotrys musiformis TaxID=47236 RepID=A0AAV9WDA9_9PEZI
MTVTLLALPPELVDEILSYVSKRDFRRFSRCSHACRDFIVPRVFNRIEWRTPTKAAAFRDGGTVGHLRPLVYHISMHSPGRPNELFRAIDAFQVYMDVLTLFPNIKSLWFNLTTIVELEANLIHTIFTKLSTCPAFHTLKSINFTCKRFSSFSLHDLSGAKGQDYFAALPEKYHEYFGPRIRKEDNVDSPPGPPGLTELVVVTDRFSLTPTRRAEPNLSFLHQSSANTLTRLRIRCNVVLLAANPGDGSEPKTFNWSGLKQVQLEVGDIDLHSLPGIANSFPDLENLVIVKAGPWYGVNRSETETGGGMSRVDMLCNAFRGVGKLKRLRLPWPTGDFGGGFIHNKSQIPAVDLEEAVNAWVRGGADMLEKVVFARDFSESVPGRLCQRLIGFNIESDGPRVLSSEPWWKVRVETGDVLQPRDNLGVQGIWQRSFEELFQVPPENKPRLYLYGKENWYS